MNNATRTDVQKTKVTVDRVFASEFQKAGSLTAQVRQVITKKSWYPTKQPTDSLTNNLFDTRDFGYEEQEFTSEENRVAFILVPTNQTQESVQALIDGIIERNTAVKTAMRAENVTSHTQLKPETVTKLKSDHKISAHEWENLNLTNPCVYKVLSNHPILSTQQVDAIRRGIRTKEDIAENQVIRYGKGDVLEGNLITDSYGKPQYKRNVFSKFLVEDEDKRTSDLNDYFTTDVIAAELGTAVLENSGDVLAPSGDFDNQSDTKGQSA